MLNSLNISGRLVADPELKTVGNDDVPVVNFRIANDTGWGEQKKTGFYNVTAWRGLAQSIAGYKKKGDYIIISGQLTFREYEDSNGNNRNAVEITARDVEFGPRTDSGESSGGTAAGGPSATPATTKNDVPF